MRESKIKFLNRSVEGYHRCNAISVWVSHAHVGLNALKRRRIAKTFEEMRYRCQEAKNRWDTAVSHLRNGTYECKAGELG